VLIEEYLRRRALRKKGQSFLDYVQHVAPWVVIEEVHCLLADHFERLRRGEIDRLMIAMPPRTGKLLADSTPVITQQGWKPHGELRVGDVVFHPSGEPILVEAVSPKDVADYEVEFDTGEVVKCHGNHEWTVFDRSRNGYRTVETKWFLGTTNEGKQRKLWQAGKRARYSLPDVTGVEFPRAELLIDPYVLGVWLGDGTAGKPWITMADTDIWRVVPKFLAAGYNVGKTYQHKTTGVPSVAFTAGGRKGPGMECLLAKHLAALGVYKDKHIPEVYLRASATQRRGLLAGLVDTDGHVDVTGRVFVSTCSERLRDGVIDLCRTLGYRPYVVTDQPRLSTSGIQGRKPVFKVMFQPTERLLTVLPRKQPTKFAVRRKVSVVDVRKTATPEPGHCVQVSSSDGLYVVGKTFLATHNSLFTSILLPSWWEGHYPSDKLLHASYASTLVEKFGRQIRNQIMADDYQQVFPGTQITKDSRAAAQWATTAGGEYNAVGVGGGVAGKGGNLLIIDDPMSEQDMFSRSVMDSIYEWYGAGFYTRRQPDRNALLLTMTRWAVADLAGRLLADAVTKEDADQWVQLVIPAILDDKTAALLNQYSHDPHITTPHTYKAGDSFSPRRWPLLELIRTKNTVSRKAWAALYMQSPVEEGGGILQRDHWKPWKSTALPKIEFILQGYDTAFEEGEANDFSARITWGVFKRESDGKLCVLMLERMKERLSFPKLLDNALDAYKEYGPDRVIIEKAASGIPLIQEFRKRGIPVSPIPPKGSKIARANAAAVVLEQGVVYYPYGKRWAEEVIDECATFPNGQHDDIPDVVAHCLNYFRRMFLLEAPDDAEDDDDEMDKTPARSYAVRRSRLPAAA
jgi:predicted phage terminase large subunit-like protein